MKRLVKKLDKLSTRLDEFNIIESRDDVDEIVNSFTEYLEAHPNIKGLAANQLGYDKRAFAISFKEGVQVYLNAMITYTKGLHTSVEEDPSIIDKKFLVCRNDEIHLSYQTQSGTYEEVKYTYKDAGDLVQHLVQLTDGLLISDFGLEVFDDFLEASEAEQQEVAKMYLEHIKNQAAHLQEEIDDDPEAKKIQETISFITKAAAGEIQLEYPHPVMPKTNRKERRYLKRKGLLDKLVDEEGRWKFFGKERVK